MYRLFMERAPLYMMESCTQTADVISRHVSGRRSFRVIDWTAMVLVDVLLLRACRPGISLFDLFVLTFSGVIGLFCEILTRCILSALEIFYKNALYKFTVY